MIEINIPERKLNLGVAEAEIAERRAKWRPPEPKTSAGFLALYAQTTLAADQGAAMQNWAIAGPKARGAGKRRNG